MQAAAVLHELGGPKSTVTPLAGWAYNQIPWLLWGTSCTVVVRCSAKPTGGTPGRGKCRPVIAHGERSRQAVGQALVHAEVPIAAGGQIGHQRVRGHGRAQRLVQDSATGQADIGVGALIVQAVFSMTLCSIMSGPMGIICSLP